MSADSLYRLVYISRNANVRGAEHELDQILATSTRNNAPVGVTGALMFNAGCFAQVLEGPQQAVESTFERIQIDERHDRIVLLSFDPVAERGFPHWSMAYVGADTEATRKFADIAASGFDAALLANDRIYDLLHQHLLEAEAQVA